nr:hypothetical protein [Pectinatus frisingensis]
MSLNCSKVDSSRRELNREIVGCDARRLLPQSWLKTGSAYELSAMSSVGYPAQIW